MNEKEGRVATKQGTRGVTTAVCKAPIKAWMQVINELRWMHHGEGGGYPLDIDPLRFVKIVEEDTRREQGYVSSSICVIDPRKAIEWSYWARIVDVGKSSGISVPAATELYLYLTCRGRAFIWGGGFFGFTTSDNEGSEDCYTNYYLRFIGEDR